MLFTQLGPYFLDEELAEGGMARVFLARLRGLGGFEKQLVIKQIKPELARDPKFVELFVREANTLVALSHPHIVQVYELGAADGTYYLSMEYVEGATIARILEDGPLSPALAAHVASQICEALDYAHGRFGILHRDVTPRNIIVDTAGHARLLDFGIAIPLSERTSELFGSPGYMSPEQARGDVLDARSDLFSLGAVLFEMLCQGSPFADQTLKVEAVLRAELKAQPAPLVDVACSLLRAPQEARPAASEVAKQLRAFLAQTRPEGVLDEMRQRAEKARLPVRASRKVSEQPSEATARVEAQSIATSPVLTELIRSASGLAARPEPPSRVAPDAPPQDGPSTRRIRDPKSEMKNDFATRATRFMFKAWPSLALFSMLLAFFLSYRRSVEREAAANGPESVQSASVVEESPDVAQSAPAPARAPFDAAEDAGAPEVPATQPVEPKAPSTEEQEPKRATLSLNAQPWAEVSLDGKPVGTTPLRNLKLRAGQHRLRFVCPPLGRSSELLVQLEPKADARIVVDLQENPARTFLDGAKEVR